jgi:putative endonuclease
VSVEDPSGSSASAPHGGPSRSRTAGDRRVALALGAQAEAWVAQELEAGGWRIIGRNVHIGGGELDIVAERGGCVRFVEVKARAPGDDGLEAITPSKQRKLRRAAEGWLQQAGPVQEVAFLIALVETHADGWSLECIDDAF